jgi:hypothetical protein
MGRGGCPSGEGGDHVLAAADAHLAEDHLEVVADGVHGVMTVDHATESPTAAGTRVLLETTWATWRFTAIRGLLSIGAFEQLADGPLTIDELADRCGANPEILRRVLRCVAATGLLRSAGPSAMS